MLESHPLFAEYHSSPKRDQLWQKSYIQSLSPIIEAEVQEELQKNSARNCLLWAQNLSKKLKNKNSSSSLLRAFLYLSQTLKVVSEALPCPMVEAELVFESAKAILKAQKVSPTSSRIRFVHHELHQSISQVYKKNGKHWLAAWHAKIALRSQDESLFGGDPKHLFENFARLLRAADLSGALEQLDLISNEQLVSREELHLCLSYARCFRLAGDPLRALNVLEAYPRSFTLSFDDKTIFEWERLRSLSLLQNSSEELVLFVRKLWLEGRRHKLPASWNEILIETHLWARTLGNGQGARELPELSQKTLVSTQAQFYKSFFEALDSELPVDERLPKLGWCLDRASSLKSLEEEQLVWNIAARSLFRTRQEAFLSLCLAKVKSLSLTLSSGESQDLLQILAEGPLEENATIEFLPQIRSGFFRRASGYASTTIRLAKILGRKRLGKISSRKLTPSDLSPEEFTELGKILCQGLAELKGPVMKVGQLSSYSIASLSPAIQNALEPLQKAALPVDPLVIRQRLEEEFGQPIAKLFKHFQNEPIGVGSIGQVHAATLWSGEEVAVKVQYPDIAQAVRFDLRILKALSPILNILLPQLQVPRFLAELEARIKEECDYRLEQSFQEAFAKRFAGDADIYIPKVYPEWCTATVLTSERIRGHNFKAFVAEASQAQKDRAGRAIVRFVVSSCRDGFFNTDPHPGNFIFLKNKIACLDFGSVKSWEPERARPWADLIRAGVFHQPRLFVESVKAMGMIQAHERSLDFDKLYEVIAPGKTGMWTTSGSQALDLKTMEDHAQQIFMGSPEINERVTIPAEYVFGFRVYFGHMALVAKMGAVADWNALVRETMGPPSEAPDYKD